MDRHVMSPGAGAKIRASFLRHLVGNANRPNALGINARLNGFFTDSFMALGTFPDPQRIEVVKLTTDILPAFDSELTESSASSASSLNRIDNTTGDNAVIQQFSDTQNRWIDSDDKVTVEDVYGLPYERDSLQLAYLHPDREHYIIIPQQTIRTAKTVKDVNGQYPPDPRDPNGSSSDPEEETPRIFAIQFVAVTFPQQAGQGDLTPRTLTRPNVSPGDEDSDSPPHAYAYNLADCYIAEGEIVWAFWMQGQWLTHVLKGISEKKLVTLDADCGPDGLELDQEYWYFEDGVVKYTEDANP